MITKSTLHFLKQLSKNNEREWFHEHKADYTKAREDAIAAVQRLIEGIAEFDSGVAEAELDPKKCIMRIARDVRFSKDKTPYKPNFFAYISKGGRKSPYAGYYLNIEPGSSFLGGGIYMPEPTVLAAIRQEIDYNLPEWERIATNEELLQEYGTIQPSGELVRPPKGYDKENPALKWLKYKGWYTQKNLSDAELQEQSVEELMKSYRTVQPMVDFINRGISG